MYSRQSSRLLLHQYLPYRRSSLLVPLTHRYECHSIWSRLILLVVPQRTSSRLFPGCRPNGVHLREAEFVFLTQIAEMVMVGKSFKIGQTENRLLLPSYGCDLSPPGACISQDWSSHNRRGIRGGFALGHLCDHYRIASELIAGHLELLIGSHDVNYGGYPNYLATNAKTNCLALN